MARAPQDRIAALLEKWEPEIRDAFLASIADIVDRAQLGRIITALENGDVEGALRAVNVDPAAFLPLDTAIRQSFLEGGVATAAKIPAAVTADRVAVRFDARNPTAETWLANHSSQAVTEIVDDQRAAIRTALAEGMTRGDNPRTTALNIVGRMNPATGRREGGIVGLTSQMSGYVANARAELLSGDPKRMERYFTRGRRDKKFDSIVRKAIKEGKPVDAASVTRLTSRYADRLLAKRGQDVGRTESIISLNTSEFEAYRQAGEKGVGRIRKVWRTARDSRVRDSHRAQEGETRDLMERFSNGLLYPGDPAGPPEEIINERCRLVYRIDRLSNLE